jgi:hypothetical protein
MKPLKVTVAALALKPWGFGEPSGSFAPIMNFQGIKESPKQVELLFL